jgi:hypothetical protein
MDEPQPAPVYQQYRFPRPLTSEECFLLGSIAAGYTMQYGGPLVQPMLNDDLDVIGCWMPEQTFSALVEIMPGFGQGPAKR